jgi:hypothetical protein
VTFSEYNRRSNARVRENFRALRKFISVIAPVFSQMKGEDVLHLVVKTIFWYIPLFAFGACLFWTLVKLAFFG